MSFLPTLIADLRERYNPEALILHGSHANGNAKEHSDWDVFVLLNDIHAKVTTYVLEGQHIDAYGLQLPVTLEDKWTNFVSQVATGKVVYDPKGEAQKVLTQMQELYKAGPAPMVPEDWEMRKRYWQRAIGRLVDYQNEPVIFLAKFGDFYERMTRYYFEKKGIWSMPLYQALPYIQEHDAEYAEFITRLASSTLVGERIELCKEAYRWIFEETI